MSIRHPKARGEWAELRFMLRATELGLRVTKPWGDNSPYDLVIETTDASSACRSSAPTSAADAPTNATSTPTATPIPPPRSISSPPTSSRQTRGTSSPSAPPTPSPTSS
ncbi:MAG: hypothetical protein LAP86_26845 [Acidobacteriia bacterium]|nr:hypothetical protein [Terriglobia bacterium]